MAAGIGLLALWAVSGFLFELAFVEVVLLGALLLAAFQTLVRRRPLRTLLVRDTASFARRWWGKLLVAAVLVALPAAMVVTSLGGSRYGRYADDSWKALLMLVVLAAAYLASRRLLTHRAHRCGDRRAGVLGLVPEPGRHPQRRRHGPRRTSTSTPTGAGWPATTTSPSPRSTWTRPSRCGWPASAPTTRRRWRSGR